MEPNVVAWLFALAIMGCFLAWLLSKIYEHDYNKANKKEDFDYWS